MLWLKGFSATEACPAVPGGTGSKIPGAQSLVGGRPARPHSAGRGVGRKPQRGHGRAAFGICPSMFGRAEKVPLGARGPRRDLHPGALWQLAAGTAPGRTAAAK